MLTVEEQECDDVTGLVDGGLGKENVSTEESGNTDILGNSLLVCIGLVQGIVMLGVVQFFLSSSEKVDLNG